MAFFSTTLTVLTSALPITNNKPQIRKVSQIQIVVRSMGTATYIGIGGPDSQDRRLTSVGSSLSISAEVGPVFNPLVIWAISDTADAVIEVFGEAVR